MTDITVSIEDAQPIHVTLAEAVNVYEGDGGGGGVTDHGALTGLADDDHPQYHNDARGDARYYTKAQTDTALGTKLSSVVAGTNVTIDATDPQNPVISATGGEGGGGLAVNPTTNAYDTEGKDINLTSGSSLRVDAENGGGVYLSAADMDAYYGRVASYEPDKIALEGSGSNVAVMDMSGLTAERTFTMPDKDGTLATLDDIASGGGVGGGLALVSSGTFTDVLNLTGLDGDTDGVYELHIDWAAEFGIQLAAIRINADEINAHYKMLYREFYYSGTSGGAGSSNSSTSGNGGFGAWPWANYQQKHKFVINAKSGRVRFIRGEYFGFTEDTDFRYADLEMFYTETAVNLTQIDVVIGTTSVTKNYQLYKLQQS